MMVRRGEGRRAGTHLVVGPEPTNAGMRYEYSCEPRQRTCAIDIPSLPSHAPRVPADDSDITSACSPPSHWFVMAVTGAIGHLGQCIVQAAESSHGACRSRRSVMMDIDVFSLVTTGSSLTANLAEGLKSCFTEVRVRLTVFMLSRVNP